MQIELTKKEVNIAIFCIQKFMAEVDQLESNSDYRYGKDAYDIIKEALYTLTEQRTINDYRRILQD